MKRIAKRCLAMLLSVMMVLNVNPAIGHAAGTAGTYVKINSMAELTSGKYVLVVNSGYALPELNGKWLGDGTETKIAVVDDKVVNPDSKFVWELMVTGDQVTLTDSNGKTIKPSSTNNDMGAGSYSWTFEENSGIFTIKTSDLNKTLASNTSYDNKFRAYADVKASNCNYVLFRTYHN